MQIFIGMRIDNPGTYAFSAEAAAGGVDPLMSLARFDEDGVCHVLRQDDDTGDGLNSLFELKLEKGRYVIAVQSIGDEGPIMVKGREENQK